MDPQHPRPRRHRVSSLRATRDRVSRPDPGFAAAARRSNSAEPVTIKQSPGSATSRRKGEAQEVAEFDVERSLRLRLACLGCCRTGPSRLPQLPALLAECGVRLVFAEGLRGGKLDGAVAFLGDGRSVIGLTTRFNRFDSLVFTLLHECAHLTLGHIDSSSGAIIDDDLIGDSSDSRELAANEQASTWRFPAASGIGRISVPAVIEASNRYEVHPSIVIGRIQMETQRWSLYRARIPKSDPNSKRPDSCHDPDHSVGLEARWPTFSFYLTAHQCKAESPDRRHHPRPCRRRHDRRPAGPELFMRLRDSCIEFRRCSTSLRHRTTHCGKCRPASRSR